MCHPPEKDEALQKIDDPMRAGVQEFLGALGARMEEIRNEPMVANIERENENLMRQVRVMGDALREQINEAERIQRELEQNAQANGNGAHEMDADGEAAENDGQVENPAYRDFIDDDLD